MKLRIGETIRTRRRAMNLTQEQLGDQLGVSYQAISRWENGTAYPDIEFLPTLAKFFDLTVDRLLGYGEEERKNRANMLFEKLNGETTDPAQVIEILRELRREHLFDCGYDFWVSAANFYRLPGVLPELRMMAEAILAKSTDKHLRDAVIRHMSRYEDDAHIAAFLKNNAATLDLNYNTLCRKRYEFRRETEKYEVMNQIWLRDLIDELTGNFQMGENDRKLPAEEMLRLLKFQLGVLNWFCRVEPSEEHPVFGDGVLDEWSAHRISLGLYLVGCLASTGDPEGAFAALEDVVWMLERIMKEIADAEDGIVEIKVRCQWLDRAKVAVKQLSGGTADPTVLVNMWKFGQDEDCLGGGNIWAGETGPDGAYFVLTSDAYRNKQMLDPIRDDPRYGAYVERIRKMIP